MLGSLVACSGAAPVPATVASTTLSAAEPGTMVAKRPPLSDLQTRAIKEMFVAMNAHDAAATASFYADRAVFKGAGLPLRQGRDVFQARLAEEFKAAPDGKYTADRVLVNGDAAIVQWTFTGTNTGGPLMPGVPATGKAVGYQGVSIDWFNADGKVKEQHTYFDARTVLTQAGVMKGKARAIPAVGDRESEILIAKATPREEAQSAMVKKADDLYDEKDLEGLMEQWNEDAVLDSVGDVEPLVGKDAIERDYAAGFKAFPTTNTKVTGIWSAGPVTIQEMVITVTREGAPTPFHMVEVTELKNGKTSRELTYMNHLENQPADAAPAQVASK
jgi:steroid delta-isomerase-like uncharacterized protein